jgi:hypothetical protein
MVTKQEALLRQLNFILKTQISGMSKTAVAVIYGLFQQGKQKQFSKYGAEAWAAALAVAVHKVPADTVEDI